LTTVMASEAKTASKAAVNCTVPVTDQKAEGVDAITEVGQQVAGGLSGPGRRGVSGHAEKMDLAGADRHHKQNREAAQRNGVEGAEIGGQQPASLRVQEGPPSRAGTDAMPNSGEFTLDPTVAPRGVLPRQAQHQSPILSPDRGQIQQTEQHDR